MFSTELSADQILAQLRPPQNWHRVFLINEDTMLIKMLVAAFYSLVLWGHHGFLDLFVVIINHLFPEYDVLHHLTTTQTTQFYSLLGGETTEGAHKNNRGTFVSGVQCGVCRTSFGFGY